MWKRILIICTLGAFTGILVIPLNPVNSKLFNLAFLGCVVGTWLGFSILTWKRKPLRVIALTLPFLIAIPFMLPGDVIDKDALRKDYVQRMANFEGTKYHWGGENSRGIDCSGLPRRALRDALLTYGISNLNGRAFRNYLEHWWFDASANALAEGYRSYTVPLGVEGTIRQMDHQNLLPGDLAVTTCGTHILAYMGNEKWIQADPGIGAVATLHARTDENSWFGSTVTTHRWQILEGQ